MAKDKKNLKGLEKLIKIKIPTKPLVTIKPLAPIKPEVPKKPLASIKSLDPVKPKILNKPLS